MPAFAVSKPFKPLKWQVINKQTKRVVFRDYSYEQAIRVCAEFPHLAFRPHP